METVMLQLIEGSDVFRPKFMFEFPRNRGQPIATMRENISRNVYDINKKISNIPKI